MDEARLTIGAKFETHAGNTGTVLKEPFQHGAHRVCEVSLERNGCFAGGHPYFDIGCIARVLSEDGEAPPKDAQ